MGQLGSRVWGWEEEEWTEAEEADGDTGRRPAAAESMGLGLTVLRERMVAVAAGRQTEEETAQCLQELGREMEQRLRRGLAGWKEAAEDGQRRAAAAEAEERAVLARLGHSERARLAALRRAAAAEEEAARAQREGRLAEERADHADRQGWDALDRAEKDRLRQRLRADQAEARNISLEAQLSRAVAALQDAQRRHDGLLDDLQSSSSPA